MVRVTKLRRGFVTEANRWAIELRKETGTPPNGPLCPWRLASHLGVPLFALSDLPDCDSKTSLMSKRRGHDFSAAVCFEGTASFILYNDAHDIKRQASDLAHEIAHILLRHPASNPFQPDGVREFSPEHEAEAERLGPTLLVSDAAALRAHALIEGGKFDLEGLAENWRVTKDVLLMRINLSGARKRFRRAA